MPSTKESEREDLLTGKKKMIPAVYKYSCGVETPSSSGNSRGTSRNTVFYGVQDRVTVQSPAIRHLALQRLKHPTLGEESTPENESLGIAPEGKDERGR